MMFRTFLAFLLVCAQVTLTAQADKSAEAYLIEASRAVDSTRYEDVRGTPYRYEDFGTVILYDPTLNPYQLERANFNGFTSQFEYYTDDGQLRELAGPNFLRVEVPQPDSSKHVYGFGLNPKFRKHYAQVIHRGEAITATMVYDVKNDEKITETVGKTLKFQRFNAKELHFAVVDGEFKTLKRTTKAIAEDLGHKAALIKFMKANKLKPTRMEDLVRIYAEAERLFGATN